MSSSEAAEPSLHEVMQTMTALDAGLKALRDRVANVEAAILSLQVDVKKVARVAEKKKNSAEEVRSHSRTC